MKGLSALIDFVGDDEYGPLSRVERKHVRDILQTTRDPLRPHFVAGRIVQVAAMLTAMPLEEEVVNRAQDLLLAMQEVVRQKGATNLEVLLAVAPLLLEFGLGPDADEVLDHELAASSGGCFP